MKKESFLWDSSCDTLRARKMLGMVWAKEKEAEASLVHTLCGRITDDFENSLFELVV